MAYDDNGTLQPSQPRDKRNKRLNLLFSSEITGFNSVTSSIRVSLGLAGLTDAVSLTDETSFTFEFSSGTTGLKQGISAKIKKHLN